MDDTAAATPQAGHLYLVTLTGEAYFRARDDAAAKERAYCGLGAFPDQEMSGIEALLHSTNCECGAGNGEEVG